MGSQQIVPAVAIDQGRSLAVYGDVFLHIAFDALTCLGVELYQPDAAKVGSVGSPKATCRGVEQQTGVNGITVLHAVAGSHLYGSGEMEVGRLGVKRLIPHGQNAPIAAILRDESTATRAEGIVFAVALSDGRRVVNVWLVHLSIGIKGTQAEGYQKKSCTFHRLIE